MSQCHEDIENLQRKAEQGVLQHLLSPSQFLEYMKRQKTPTSNLPEQPTVLTKNE